jgi:hypothetical protein
LTSVGPNAGIVTSGKVASLGRRKRTSDKVGSARGNTCRLSTRRQHPEHYWCAGEDDGSVQYFWDEQTVSREEYLAYSGKDDCT